MVEQWSSKSSMRVRFLLSLYMQKFSILKTETKKSPQFNKFFIFKANHGFEIFDGCVVFRKNNFNLFSYKSLINFNVFLWFFRKNLVKYFSPSFLSIFFGNTRLYEGLNLFFKIVFSAIENHRNFLFITKPLLVFFYQNNFLLINKYFSLANKYANFNENRGVVPLFFSNVLPSLNKNFFYLKNQNNFFFAKINQGKITNLLISTRILTPKRFKDIKKYKFIANLNYKNFFQPYDFRQPVFAPFQLNTLLTKISFFLKKNVKYFFLANLLFKKIPNLNKRFKNTKFNKYSLSSYDMLYRSSITISASKFSFDNFEFSFLGSVSKFFPTSSFFYNYKRKFSKNSSFPTKMTLLPNFLQIKPLLTKITPKLKLFFFNKAGVTQLFSIFFNKTLFKFFYYYGSNLNAVTDFFQTSRFFSYFTQFFFYTKRNDFFFNNINKNKNFSYFLKKKIIKTLNYKKFDLWLAPWYSHSLIRFLEKCSGKRVLLKFFFFLGNCLNFYEQSRCLLWSQKLQNFQKTIGNGFFLTESIQIIYIAIKIKDPYFLINWVREVFNKINFWKYKMFFHYLKYLFKYFFWSIFSELKIKGLKFKLKGKISVTGNARTRTVTYQIGHVSHSTYDNKILHAFDLVKTFTGVIGLQIWMVF